MLEIRYDDSKIKQLERQLRGFGKTVLPKVMSRGLNRTATQARTQSARFLSKRTGIKVGDVRKRIMLHRASYGNWRSAITVSRKRLSLRYLSPKKTKRGLSVKSGKRRVLVRRAFEALKEWFIRLPESGGYKMTIGVGQAMKIDSQKLVGRLPIARIRGPILAKVYSSAEAETRKIYIESMKLLEKNIHDQVNLILARRLPA